MTQGGFAAGGWRAMASVLIALVLLTPAVAVQPASSQAVVSSGFTVVSAVWGTAANPVEAAPGTQNVPLTITLQYNYYNTGQGISATLRLPVGFTDTNGNSAPVAYSATPVTSGNLVTLTFNLNIGSAVPLGTYVFPLTINWGAVVSTYPVQTVSQVQDTQLSVMLKGKVQLQFSAGQPTLSPGQVNQVQIVVSNTGTGDAANVVLSVSAASSLLSSSTVSVLNAPPEIFSIKANSSETTDVNVYAPESVAGSSVSLNVGGTYSDAYGNTRAVSAAFGVYVQSTAAAPVTVAAQSFRLTPGAVNNVTLVVSNVGSIGFSGLQLSVTVPISVSLLRQFPVTLPALQAGQSTQVSMPIFVSGSLSGTPITIPATVTYTSTAGATSSTTQSLGFYVPLSQSAGLGLSGYSYSPPLIFPGTTVATLQVAIYNSGSTPSYNVSVALDPAAPVYALTKGALVQSAGVIPVGQSVPFAFTLGIQNSTLPLNCTMALTVTTPGASALRFSIPFAEQPKANFKVVAVHSSGIASGDGADQVTVTLQNEGGAAAQLATFAMQPSYIFEPSTQGSFTTTPNAGVGTVAPGARTNLTVVIQVNPNIVGGEYPLVFHASWTQLGASQPFGQDIRLMVPVSLSIFQQVNNVLLSAPFLVGLVIVVAALVVLRRRRKTAPKANKESGAEAGG